MSAVNKRLLEDEAAADTGVSDAYPAIQLTDPTVHVIGLATGDTVDVEGTNEPDPSTASAWHQLTQISDNDDIYQIPEGINWIRLNVTAGAGGGTLNAYLCGFRRET